MNSKQTVKIFLAEGNPTGLRTLELFNWNGKGLVIPRDRIESALKREDVDTQGVYILIGDSPESEITIYIGETENIKERLRSHNKQKDFWDTAICFYSKDDNLNKAHVKYLEELLVKEVSDAGRAQLENGNQPKQTKLSESDESEILIFAENIKLILASIGYTFLKKPVEYEEVNKDVFVCAGPAADARGIYTSEGMVVFKGSKARKNLVESAKERYIKKRPLLIEQGILAEDGAESYIFTQDVTFSSPSNAAQNVLGRNANGWTEWKRELDGKTLDELFRQV
jgi:predicted GIY-YIG superfamily endonuclease